MEIKTSNDVAINMVTMKKMLKPVIDFIQEHEGRADRNALFGLCINILTGKINVTPIEIQGTLFSMAVDNNRNSYDRALFMAKKGINTKATVDTKKE